ncbi:MAG: hypothetical protein NTW61_09855 [Candidatus Melainabacteria bacterium]|nr:hypothetical protein [Candidatus Melainabacteria bacterium]
MMMMSSNTVGNPDFNNISGAVPPPSRKVTLPKDKSPQLASSKPDSFERANPRDNTPEAPPTAETSAKTGGSSVIAIGLSAVSLIGAGIAGWFAVSKGGEAEAAKKLATSLETKVKTLEEKGLGVSLADVETKIKAGIDALSAKGEGALAGVKAELEGKITNTFKDHPKKAEITELINLAVADKLNRTEFEDRVQHLANKGEVSVLNQFIDIIFERLDEIDPMLGGKRVSKTIADLFKAPTTLGETPFSKAAEIYRNDTSPDKTSFTLIKAGLETDLQTPSDLLGLQQQLHNLLRENTPSDPYKRQMGHLNWALEYVSRVFQGEEIIVNSGSLPKEVYETVILKAKAVMEVGQKEGATAEEVKVAQKALVAELQQQFGKTHTEKFEAEFGTNVVKNLADIPTIGWVGNHIKDNVNPLTEPKARLDALLDMFLVEKAGLDGKHKDNPHTNANVLAEVVPTLAKALTEAYPGQLKLTDSGRISLQPEVVIDDLSPSLRSLTETLNEFGKALQPILPETGRSYSELLSKKTLPEEIAGLTPIKKLRYKMGQARVGGKQDEISNITEEMNTLLRTQLKALNEAKSVVIADTTPAISEGADKLVDKVFSSTHLQLPEFTSTYAISTSADALVAKMGENPGASSNKNSLIIVPLNKYFETAFPVPTESGAEKTLKEQQRDKAFHTLTSLLNAKKQKDKETDLTQLLPFFNFKKDHTIATITAFNQALDDLISPEEKLTHEVLMEKMEPVLKAIVTGVENSQPIEF